MGLLSAATGSVGGILADQWREFFTCDALNENTLLVRGKKRSGGRSANTKGSDNVITNGSIITVADGQAMMIVDQGAIVEFSAEPGEFIWDNSTEPSIFYGGLGEGLKQSWQTFKKRFTFGGDTAKDTRVYYVNTKELYGNKYGTPNPIPFRLTDKNINLTTEIDVKCFGEYSYRIADPIAFYKNVCANTSGDFTRDRLDSQLKTELLSALQPAFGALSEMGIPYSAIVSHTYDLTDALNKALNKLWAEKNRGLEIVSIGISSLSADEEQLKRIKELQLNSALRDPSLAYAHMVGATAASMQTAAGNEGGMGAAMGFMGMNMANNMGLNNMAAITQQQAQMQQAQQAAPQNGWKCACGSVNTGKFCSECGAPKPAETTGWKCACGAVNKGKFCSECGAKKPADQPLYRCDKCGWEPKDPANPPKFCPECGDPFNESDKV
ncbi:MAG: SPFH domain-containing protein [Clostridia bacterium]|nr:SPFH domain-containing protein [Clostridia bacterium]